MPAIQMRRVPYTRLKHVHNVSRKTSSHGQSITPVVAPSINISRSLANVRSTETSCPEFFYGSSLPKLNIGGEVRPDDVHPPDPRTLRLGKTIRILHKRLPTLLLSPLPQEILSPHITLHLFPSTHPHLPTVSGRIAYTAALWTAPVAWGRVPVVGNVKIEIISERMFKNGTISTAGPERRQERLVVRWRTCENSKGKSKILGNLGSVSLGQASNKKGLVNAQSMGFRKSVNDDSKQGDDKEFSGLFLFEFDEDGRILSHTIEHAQEGGNWDKMPRMINVTDWLLEKALGKKLEGSPGLALGYCEAKPSLTRCARLEKREG